MVVSTTRAVRLTFSFDNAPLHILRGAHSIAGIGKGRVVRGASSDSSHGCDVGGDAYEPAPGMAAYRQCRFPTPLAPARRHRKLRLDKGCLGVVT